jgi:hypothetical protein
MSYRGKQIKKVGGRYVLRSADGCKVLGTYSSREAAEAGARRIYGVHRRTKTVRRGKRAPKRGSITRRGRSSRRPSEKTIERLARDLAAVSAKGEKVRVAWAPGHEHHRQRRTRRTPRRNSRGRFVKAR